MTIVLATITGAPISKSKHAIVVENPRGRAMIPEECFFASDDT